MFNSKNVDLVTLRERAYNLRWAEVDSNVIPLTAADPDFPCAPAISEAIITYSQKRYFNYGPPLGLPFFKESVSAFMARERNVEIASSRILPVDSAAYGIYLICKSFLGPGDEAIIFDPVDFLFKYSVEATGAKSISFPIPPGKIDVDFAEMEGLITPQTRMVCLCNPLNPTGKVFTRKELESLADLAIRHNLIILSDEIWSDIVFSPFAFTSISSIERAENHTVTVSGFSKSYGLAGLRIGIVMAHRAEFMDRIIQMSKHSSTVHGANVLGQVAANAALNDCGDWLNGFISHLQKMRDFSTSSLNGIKGFSCLPPEGCYVAFVDITKSGLTSIEMQRYLLEVARVSVVPGLPEWFGPGADGYIRISFASSEEILSEAFTRIKNAMESFNLGKSVL